MKSLSKHGHHKDVDEEGHKERHGCLNEEVLVGLLHLLPVGAIHLSGLEEGHHNYTGLLIEQGGGGHGEVAHLDQGRVQVDVVRHNDGTHNADSLGQLDRATALTLGHEHSLQQLALVWTHHHILDRSSPTISHIRPTQKTL